MLTPWKKSMINLDSIFKSRDIILPTKVRLVKAMVFPVVMYGCEIWTAKKVEHWRIDAFELWRWRRLLRVPWTARRSNQYILKEISPGCSLEGLLLKLKLQYFGHLMWKTDSCEKTVMLGRIEGRRRRGWQRMRWHHGVSDGFGWTLGVVDGQRGLVCCSPWGHKSRTWLCEWTELNWTELIHRWNIQQNYERLISFIFFNFSSVINLKFEIRYKMKLIRKIFLKVG